MFPVYCVVIVFCVLCFLCTVLCLHTLFSLCCDSCVLCCVCILGFLCAVFVLSFLYTMFFFFSFTEAAKQFWATIASKVIQSAETFTANYIETFMENNLKVL